jgi:glycosyltransferase involved in cell wall biosynthesis
LHFLHVISSLAPAGGGPPEAVRQLVRAYQAAGIEVDVVCLDDPGKEFLSSVPCRVHALGQSFLGTYSFSPRLRRWLRENAHRYDAIIVNGIWTFPCTVARWAARRSRKPYGVFVHGALDPWFNKRYPLKHLKKLLYWPIQYAVLRDATAVMFTTETERDLAKTSFIPNQWRGIVIPYGINDPDHSELKEIDPKAQIETFYRSMPMLRDRRFLLFLGRIHEKKGCDLLLQAFSKYWSSEPEVDLVIAGPDQADMQRELQHMCQQLGIASRVHWPGPLSGDRKWGALRACEAFVLPSHQENFGIAVVEALAAGRPVLISNQVNIWQEIVSDRAGFAEEDTLEGTSRNLGRWFTLTEEERKELAACARSTFLQRYLITRAAGAISDAVLGS